MLGRQYHLLDVGHLNGRELARAGSRARGASVQTADRRGSAVPSVVSAGFEMRDTQDHGEGQEWFCTGDGTQDFGFGAAFGEPLASECEAGSAEHRQENSDNAREDGLLPFELCDGVDQLLVVLLYGFDGNDRTRTTVPPSGNGGARDGPMLRTLLCKMSAHTAGFDAGQVPFSRLELPSTNHERIQKATHSHAGWP